MDYETSLATRAQTWTFLTNHAVVLLLIADNAGVRIDALGRLAGISTRAVQMIVADLCRAGYLERTRVGRSNRYTVNRLAPMRHGAVRERCTVQALLAMLGAADAA
jgi:DNA-binding MarR family transcriptional regulator